MKDISEMTESEFNDKIGSVMMLDRIKISNDKRKELRDCFLFNIRIKYSNGDKEKLIVFDEWFTSHNEPIKKDFIKIIDSYSELGYLCNNAAKIITRSIYFNIPKIKDGDSVYKWFNEINEDPVVIFDIFIIRL